MVGIKCPFPPSTGGQAFPALARLSAVAIMDEANKGPDKMIC
jgi:hypothetical protein